MKMTTLKYLFYFININFVLILLASLVTTELMDAKEEASNITPDYLNLPQSIKLSKFSLTQKGYIQFLRYITEIPPIGDFTFCIWMRSANFTYLHPLLSYSMHESERLIRAWVTSNGNEIRLAIKEIEIIRVPVALQENQWYHICQSWSTKSGHWDLFLNGKLKSHGYNNKVRGIILPKHGDLVVGQEYTDFDKGLDDGIEGDIFGFNMVLSATSSPQKGQRRQKEPIQLRRISSPSSGSIKGHYIVQSNPLITLRRTSKSVNVDQGNIGENNNSTSTENLVTRVKRQNNKQDDTTNEDSFRNSRRFFVEPEIRRRVDTTKQNLLHPNQPIINTLTSTGRNNSEYFNLPPRLRRQNYNTPYSFYKFLRAMPQEKLIYKPINSYFTQPEQYGYQRVSDKMQPPLPPVFRNKNSRIANDILSYGPKPLGLRLVELSFDCANGRGAPLQGRDVLINWTKTPVRVFGGAILKKVDPFCYV